METTSKISLINSEMGESRIETKKGEAKNKGHFQRRGPVVTHDPGARVCAGRWQQQHRP